jgi:hypothetical protein
MKASVSSRAVEQRLNRALKRKGLQLRKTRGERNPQLGQYFLVDPAGNSIFDTHIDLEGLARKLEVLHGWEKLLTS